eukprot:scaffold3516_cov26-Phaeocystis_antarctica.AAC.1
MCDEATANGQGPGGRWQSILKRRESRGGPTLAKSSLFGPPAEGVPGPPLGAHHPGRSARPSIRLVGPHGTISASCLSDYCMSFCHH